jgi:hypothetical protein
MPRPVHLAAFAALLLSAAGCHAATPVAAPINADARATTAAASARGNETSFTGVRFDDAAEALAHRCDVGEIDGSTVEMKEKMHARLECLRAEVSAVSSGTSETEPLLFAAYVNDACLLQEDVQWTDPVTGVESSGTLRSFEDMACQENLLVERYFLGVARSNGASDAVADHLRTVWPRGDIARRNLVVLRSTRALGARGDTAERSAHQLAQATCAGWPELETTLGGTSKCTADVEQWYVGSVAGEKGFASEWS